MPTTAREEKAAAVAAMVAASAVPKPRGKAPKAYPLWDTQRGVWTNKAGDICSHQRSVQLLPCTTMQQKQQQHHHHHHQQQQRPAPRQRHQNHRWAQQRTIQHGGPGMQRFMRNPWRDEVPLMINISIAEPVPNWCAHLESMGLYAGGFKATYEERKWEEQSGRCRRHSV